MISKKVLLLIIFIVLPYSSFTYCGSPGGLYLLVISMNSSLEYKNKIDDFFGKYYGVDNEHSPTCDVELGGKKMKFKPSIDIFYLNRKPKEINDVLLHKSLRSEKALTELKNISRNYKDDLITGFDAVIFYNKVNSDLYFYGFSTLDDDIPLIKSNISVRKIDEDTSLSIALCKIIAQLPTPAP